jgi:hypothetical protein
METPLRFYSIAGGVLAAGLMALLLARRRRKTPEQLERERRDYLQRVGRIIDGTVIDVAEIGQEDGSHQLLIYNYDVAGVAYEASQDVTHLRQHIDMHSCRIGLPASIKYDPQSPGNSMVIAEGWSGLRSGPIFPRKEKEKEKAVSIEKEKPASAQQTQL